MIDPQGAMDLIKQADIWEALVFFELIRAVATGIEIRHVDSTIGQVQTGTFFYRKYEHGIKESNVSSSC